MGVPMVATPLAVEGMFAEHGVHCLTAQTPDDFASSIVQLATNCSLHDAIARAAHNLLRDKFSFAMGRLDAIKVLQAVGVGPVLGEHVHATCRGKRATSHAATDGTFAG